MPGLAWKFAFARRHLVAAVRKHNATQWLQRSDRLFYGCGPVVDLFLWQQTRSSPSHWSACRLFRRGFLHSSSAYSNPRSSAKVFPFKPSHSLCISALMSDGALNETLADVYPSMVGEWLWTKAAFGVFARDDKEYFEIYRDNLEGICKYAGCSFDDLREYAISRPLLSSIFVSTVLIGLASV